MLPPTSWGRDPAYVDMVEEDPRIPNMGTIRTSHAFG